MSKLGSGISSCGCLTWQVKMVILITVDLGETS